LARALAGWRHQLMRIVLRSDTPMRFRGCL
jgi:hypothetical protein